MGKVSLPRIVGAGATSASMHDHISAVLVTSSFVAVLVFAVMYLGDNSVQLPSWMIDPSHPNATLSDEVHLGATAAGLSFAGVLGIVIVWLTLLFLSAWLLIILGQLMLILALAGTGAGLLYASQNEICVSHTVTVAGISTVVSQCSPQEFQGWFYIGAIVCFALAALILLWLFCIRERIAFTAMILKSVSTVLIQLPELILIQFGASVLSVGYAIIWFFAYMEVVSRTNGMAWYYVAILNIVMLFLFFWHQLVFMNISLVTTCGAVGGWYFSPQETTSRGCFMCRPAVCTPLVRACSLSLGSIALGSLLVAVVRTIIVIVRFCAESAGNTNEIVKIACCCCICMLSCLERIIKWLTDYAFVYVAIYGTPFITSGMKVVELLLSSGVGAIAQQSLITPVINLACLLGLCAGGALGYLAESVCELGPVYLGITIGGAVGWILTGIALAPVDAGSKALFVCYAESPKEMQEKSPSLAAKLAEGAPLSPGTSKDADNIGPVP